MLHSMVPVQELFDQAYETQGLPVKTIKERATSFRAHHRCSKKSALNMLLTFLPFINTIRTYKVKKYLVSDLIAGLTVGIMHIPQGNKYSRTR